MDQMDYGAVLPPSLMVFFQWTLLVTRVLFTAASDQQLQLGHVAWALPGDSSIPRQSWPSRGAPSGFALDPLFIPWIHIHPYPLFPLCLRWISIQMGPYWLQIPFFTRLPKLWIRQVLIMTLPKMAMSDFNQSLFGSFDVLSSFKAFQGHPKFPQNETLLVMNHFLSAKANPHPVLHCFLVISGNLPHTIQA